MSLNADWSKIKDWKEVVLSKDDLEAYTPLATTFAFLTITVGIQEITDKTLNEFFLRVAAWERCRGAFHTKDGAERPITREDVERFKGLSTNASPLTRTQFKRNLANAVFDELERLERQAKRAAELEQRA
jgi:hypothetical protein